MITVPGVLGRISMNITMEWTSQQLFDTVVPPEVHSRHTRRSRRAISQWKTGPIPGRTRWDRCGLVHLRWNFYVLSEGKIEMESMTYWATILNIQYVSIHVIKPIKISPCVTFYHPLMDIHSTCAYTYLYSIIQSNRTYFGSGNVPSYVY